MEMEIESGEKLQRRREVDEEDKELGFLWRKDVDGSGENRSVVLVEAIVLCKRRRPREVEKNDLRNEIVDLGFGFNG